MDYESLTFEVRGWLKNYFLSVRRENVFKKNALKTSLGNREDFQSPSLNEI